MRSSVSFQTMALLILWLGGWPLVISGQVHLPRTRLTPAETSADGRTWISSVRELADGRVIVVDRNEFVVYFYSQDMNELGTVGRQGQGPGEYKAPHELIELRGDSTILVDLGQGRLLVLGPGGTTTDRMYRPDQIAEARFLLSSAFQAPTVAESGQWYFEGASSTGYLSEKVVFDSIAIERREDLLAGSADTVASFPNSEDWRGVPRYRPAADWTVCQNGTVYIALPDPYRVTAIPNRGPAMIGRSVEYLPVRVTERVVERWREAEQLFYTVSSMQARGGGSSSFMFSPVNPANLDKWDWWPATLPPFGADAVHCGPGNQLWVERITEPGSPPLVDVFGPDGSRVRQFELPDGTRIVGFGPQSVYAVVTDDLALQYLMRIPVPNGREPAVARKQ